MVRLNEIINDELNGSEFTKARLYAAIARSASRILLPEIQNLLKVCLVEKPARIKSVQFEKGQILFTVRWPFHSPEPTGSGDDWLGSAKKVEDFLKDFRSHLLRQQAGRRLANIFSEEFGKYLLRYFKVHRVAEYQIEQSDRPLGQALTVKKILEEAIHETTGRRLAGPPKRQLSKRLIEQTRHKGQTVLNAIVNIQTDLQAWVQSAEARGQRTSESQLMAMLMEKYHSEENQWMVNLRLCFRKLKLKPDYRGPETKPLLSSPKSFSAVALARLIVRDWFYRENGFDISQANLQRLVSLRSRRHPNVNRS